MTKSKKETKAEKQVRLEKTVESTILKSHTVLTAMQALEERLNKARYKEITEITLKADTLIVKQNLEITHLKELCAYEVEAKENYKKTICMLSHVIASMTVKEKPKLKEVRQDGAGSNIIGVAREDIRQGDLMKIDMRDGNVVRANN